jgi:hypothetical protein
MKLINDRSPTIAVSGRITGYPDVIPKNAVLSGSATRELSDVEVLSAISTKSRLSPEVINLHFRRGKIVGQGNNQSRRVANPLLLRRIAKPDSGFTRRGVPPSGLPGLLATLGGRRPPYQSAAEWLWLLRAT